MNVLSFEKLINQPESSVIWERHRLLLLESASFYSSVLDRESPDVKLTLAYIHNCFNELNKRWEGLQMLSLLFQQSLSNVVIDNYRSWIHHLKKFILHDDELKVRLLAVKILGKILCYCHSDNDHLRYLSTQITPGIIPQLALLDNKWQLVVVYGFYYFLNNLPGSTKQYTIDIKRRLLETLNSSDYEVVEISALCIAKISFTPVSNNRGSTPSTSWLVFFQKLLNTLNSILNSLFEDFEIENAIEVDDKQLIPLPLILDCHDRTSIFVDSFFRCGSICLCLEKMLLNGDGKSVLAIPIENILQVVSRILAVNAKCLMDNESAKQKDLLFTVLPMLHLSSLKVLEALILCCKKHLLIHDQRILSLLLQGLSWSSAWKSEKLKSAISKLRVFSYRVLISWCQTMGSSTDFSKFGNLFLNQIVSDAFYEQKPSEEKITPVAVTVTKSKSKKRKVDHYLTIASTDKTGHLSICDLCEFSLKALKILLCNCGDDFKSSEIKNLFAKVTSTLFKISSDVMDHPACLQFSNVPCRKALYKLLLTMVTSQSFISHELLSISMRIFSNGCQDRNSQVSQLCLQAKSICHLLVEPIRRHLPMKATNYPSVSEEEYVALEKSLNDVCVETIPEKDDVDMGNYAENINQENMNKDNTLTSQSVEEMHVEQNICVSILDESSVNEEISINKENEDENTNLVGQLPVSKDLTIADDNCKSPSLDESKDMDVTDSFDVKELYNEAKPVFQSDFFKITSKIDDDKVKRIMDLFVLSASADGDENAT